MRRMIRIKTGLNPSHPSKSVANSFSVKNWLRIKTDDTDINNKSVLNPSHPSKSVAKSYSWSNYDNDRDTTTGRGAGGADGRSPRRPPLCPPLSGRHDPGAGALRHLFPDRQRPGRVGRHEPAGGVAGRPLRLRPR
ncbi:protein of unknown function [Candidatus Promineifilum breve]|uniref:Uncharacterized protein n=1 Tax=Candidatus Promineifilum breve TaxID=1806508 RepID=A0A160T7S3_9CHLR|nr:protein of unknown function [Candidatus Promineifilum breve]